MKTTKTILAMRFKSLLVITAATFGLQLYGQQHPSLDNYLFTPVAISPAHAGMQDQHLTSIVDAQWVGLKGAPRTGMVSMDYLNLRGLGLNMSLITDQVGPAMTQHMAFSAAYHLDVTQKGRLATGLRFTMGNTTVDLVDETYYDQVDPNIYNLQGPFRVNVDIGSTYYTDVFYAGASFKNVNRAELYESNYTAQILQVFGGYNLDLTKKWTFRTSFLASTIANTPMDVNLHGFIEHKSAWGLGAHFSPNDEAGLLFKLRTSKDWRFFYQYNYPLTDLVYITRSSHVVGVSFDVVQRIESFTSPRLFL